MTGSVLLTRALDGLLILLLIEAVTLTLIHRLTGRLPRPSVFLPTIAAGGAIMVAMRLALAGATWPLVALCLAAAGTFHAVDMRARLRRPGGAD